MFAVVLAYGSSSAPACQTSCDDAVDRTPEVFDGGQTDASGTLYQSADWQGRYLKFPPRRVFEFVHHLRQTPFIVMPYVAFSPCPYAPEGTCADDKHPAKQSAPAAGDLAPITAVNETSFRVTNNTCETFYLRVTAYAGNFEAAGGSTSLDDDAGGNGAGGNDASSNDASGNGGAGGT